MSKHIPVAWITKGGTGDLWWHKNSESDIPLYLEPQKEWVGLKDGEITDASQHFTKCEGFEHGALWAEAKLKERNCG